MATDPDAIEERAQATYDRAMTECNEYQFHGTCTSQRNHFTEVIEAALRATRRGALEEAAQFVVDCSPELKPYRQMAESTAEGLRALAEREGR